MAGARIRFTLNQQEFRRMTSTGTIDQAVRRAAGTVRDNAKREIISQGRVDTGKMVQSGRIQKVHRGNGSWYEVLFPGDVAWYQHEGTRDHGPRRAKILRFKLKGSGAYVFARRVRGVKPSKFLTKALSRLRVGDFRA
jgi:hypothetical protein